MGVDLVQLLVSQSRCSQHCVDTCLQGRQVGITSLCIRHCGNKFSTSHHQRQARCGLGANSLICSTCNQSIVKTAIVSRCFLCLTGAGIKVLLGNIHYPIGHVIHIPSHDLRCRIEGRECKWTGITQLSQLLSRQRRAHSHSIRHSNALRKRGRFPVLKRVKKSHVLMLYNLV